MQEFEDLWELFGLVRDHVAEHAMAYGGGAAVMVPLIYFTRKYSRPIIQYFMEMVIYIALTHTLVTLLTNFFAWLHNNTSMRAVSDRRAGVAWDTPWVFFWRREAYDPQWVIYVEGVIAVIIVILVIRFRPMRIQKPRNRTEAAKKGEFNPDQYSKAARAQELARKYSNPGKGSKGGKGRGRG